jgi:hypothetical protein
MAAFRSWATHVRIRQVAAAGLDAQHRIGGPDPSQWPGPVCVEGGGGKGLGSKGGSCSGGLAMGLGDVWICGANNHRLENLGHKCCSTGEPRELKLSLRTATTTPQNDVEGLTRSDSSGFLRKDGSEKKRQDSLR